MKLILINFDSILTTNEISIKGQTSVCNTNRSYNQSINHEFTKRKTHKKQIKKALENQTFTISHTNQIGIKKGKEKKKIRVYVIYNYLMRFLEVMRGALIAAPIKLLPVI